MNAIGEIFRAARQQRNLSIDEVSRLTKIGVRVIESIENGNLQILPPAYMRSFVRTYARFLDIPEPDISLGDAPEAERFRPRETQQVSPLFVPENTFTPSYFADPKRRSKRILTVIYSAVAILLLVVGYLVWIAPPVEPKPDDTVITRPLRILSEAIKPMSSADLVTETARGTDSMILEARAMENVWLSIVMDKKRAQQLTLEAGKVYRWSALKSFSLSIGNAGGVVFSLNGRELDRFGASGVVVRDVRILRDPARGTTMSLSNNPASVYTIEPPARQSLQQSSGEQQNTQYEAVREVSAASTTRISASPEGVQSSVPSKVSSEGVSPSASSYSTTYSTSSPHATESDSKVDTTKPRPRIAARPKQQPKVIMIEPVASPLSIPQAPTTVAKPSVDTKKN
ncbi:MAG: DUF4115 domain-containing protein [Bacteroidota bacterium]|nr:DUF4115 domain-containing protein [Candidatus Kapabacteria bacterium]MDW8220013.1 DUF4115 domain-containing protein [Bacteroidota bacterium]